MCDSDDDSNSSLDLPSFICFCFAFSTSSGSCFLSSFNRRAGTELKGRQMGTGANRGARGAMRWKARIGCILSAFCYSRVRERFRSDVRDVRSVWRFFYLGAQSLFCSMTMRSESKRDSNNYSFQVCGRRCKLTNIASMTRWKAKESRARQEQQGMTSAWVNRGGKCGHWLLPDAFQAHYLLQYMYSRFRPHSLHLEHK